MKQNDEYNLQRIDNLLLGCTILGFIIGQYAHSLYIKGDMYWGILILSFSMTFPTVAFIIRMHFVYARRVGIIKKDDYLFWKKIKKENRGLLFSLGGILFVLWQTIHHPGFYIPALLLNLAMYLYMLMISRSKTRTLVK